MELLKANIDLTTELAVTLIRPNGVCIDCGRYANRSMPRGWWRRLWNWSRRSKLIPLSMTLAAFVQAALDPGTEVYALVTTAGVNFLASDMAAGLSSPRISSMNFHDSGTGTTAAATGDTVLQTQAGPTTRATGTQTNPSANQYRTTGTISYTTTLAITEWGLFNQASQGGTLWDRRVFSAVNVINGDSIQYVYTLTINAGGS